MINVFRAFRNVWAALALALLIAFAVVSSKTGRLRLGDGRLGLQLSSAAVFTHYNRIWSQPVTLVKVDGAADWIEVSHSDLTPLGIAGYRQRWDRMIWESDRKRAPTSFWSRAADFVAERWAAGHPKETPLAEVRFVKVLRRAGDPTMDVPEGRWQLPPVAALSAKDVVELALCRRVEGQWSVVPKKGTGGKSGPNEVDEGEDEELLPAQVRPRVRIPSVSGGKAGPVRSGTIPQKPASIRPSVPVRPNGQKPPGPQGRSAPLRPQIQPGAKSRGPLPLPPGVSPSNAGGSPKTKSQAPVGYAQSDAQADLGQGERDPQKNGGHHPG